MSYLAQNFPRSEVYFYFTTTNVFRNQTQSRAVASNGSMAFIVFLDWRYISYTLCCFAFSKDIEFWSNVGNVVRQKYENEE